jgi:Transglutaminase-like superfamily
MAGSPLHKFLRLPHADRSLLVHSVILVGAARLALWALPFNTVRRLFARRARQSPSPYPTTERIGWAISVAKRFIPKGNCLPQALAAESLLTRGGFPVELRIGVAKKDDGRLEAHAWVESDGRLVVGDLTQGLDSFTPLPPLPGVARRSVPS